MRTNEGSGEQKQQQLQPSKRIRTKWNERKKKNFVACMSTWFSKPLWIVSKCETHTITADSVLIKSDSEMLTWRNKKDSTKNQNEKRKTPFGFSWIGYGIFECTIALHFVFNAFSVHIESLSDTFLYAHYVARNSELFSTISLSLSPSPLHLFSVLMLLE